MLPPLDIENFAQVMDHIDVKPLYTVHVSAPKRIVERIMG